MMVPKKSLVFAGAALLCLGSASSAQDKDAPMHRRVTEPLRPVELNLQTGTITRGPAVQQRGAPGFNTCSTLSNLDHSGFVGVDSGSAACEWIDSHNNALGDNAQRKSGFLARFAFAYCSSSLATRSGGSGGSARIGFRSGYNKGSANNLGPVSGTEIAAFNLTGLPANTACSSFFGGFNCYLINVNFGNVPFCMPSGDIGWSWRFQDLGTDGTLAKTFPFISCVQSCTGTGPDASGGMIDFVDQYCPVGSALSTFSFGTSAGGGYFTSISIDLVEAEAIPAAVVTSNPGAVNQRTLTGGPAIPGGSWSIAYNCGTAISPPRTRIIRVAFAPPVNIAYSGGRILVAITAGSGQNFVGQHAGGGQALNVPLAKEFTFYGACWQVQVWCDRPGGDFSQELTNRLTQTMGSN